MRKLILALSFVIATSGVAFAFDAPSAVGDIKKTKGSDQGEQTRVFKLVRNPSRLQDGATIVSGDAVVYSTVSDDGISIATTTTSADGAFAGIAVTNIPTSDASVSGNVNDDAGRRNWGYIQVHGMALANITAGGGNGAAVGDAMITSTDAGRVTTAPSSLLDGRAVGIARGKGGFFYDSLASDATATTVEVQIEKE